jgi:membrane fusion protein (multidrug efflux system)
MKKINIIIAVFLFLLTVFFLKVAFTKSDHKKHDDKENVIKKVDGFIVSPTYLSSSITVTGSLLAFNEVELRNEVAGRIVMVNLPEGKIVKKNTAHPINCVFNYKIREYIEFLAIQMLLLYL